MKRTRRREDKYKIVITLRKIFIHSLLITLTIGALFPIYFLITTSLKTKEDFLFNKFGLPTAIRLQNFAEAFKSGGNFTYWFSNSVIITVVSCVLAVVCTILAAYSFVFFRFKGKNFIFNVTLALMIFPPVALIIPLFIFMQRINLVNNLASVIIIYVGLLLPFGIYLIASFFSTVPREIIEAAFIDGCDIFKVLFRILVPLSRPAIVTVVVVNTLYVWNELLIAMVFLQNDKTRTLMAGLMSFKTRYDTDLPIIMSGLTIITIPIVLLYFFGSKYFIKGLTAGSLKG